MRPCLRASLLAVLVACGWATAVAADVPAPADEPRPRTHAHNDYEHPHPLFDALHQGFVSVEADIYLVGADLRVAHERAADWSAVPTLQASYLTPLRKLKTTRNNGGIYADGTTLVLLIDIKTDGNDTYARLHEILSEYQAACPGLFSEFRAAGGGYTTTRGAVTVIVTGNRPREAMKRQATRLACYDGRAADIGPDAKPDDSPAFVPLISDNWNTFFNGAAAWNGTGPIPDAARARLRQLVADVHDEGKFVRLWNLPKDAPAVWGALYDAGVDYINTDDLAGLSDYIGSRLAAGKPASPRNRAK